MTPAIPEIAAIGLLVLGVAALMRRRRIAHYPWLAAGLLFAMATTGAVLWAARLRSEAEGEMRIAESLPRGNKQAGFVTSDTCKACHPQQYESWHDSYHHTMTQRVRPESVLGDFNDVRLSAWGYEYFLHRKGEEFWVSTDDPNWDTSAPPSPRTTRDYQVFMSTGSHHFQAYWARNAAGRPQLSLPFLHLIEQKRWVPFNSIFITPPPYGRMQSSWEAVCIRCHSTAGVPEVDVPGGKDAEGLPLRSRAAELGIACEACHGQAGEHVKKHRNPLERYAEHLTKDRPDPTIVNPANLTAERSSQVCGQCHSVFLYRDHAKWLREGSTFKAGDDLNEAVVLVQAHSAVDDPIVKAAFLSDGDHVGTRFWKDGMPRLAGRDYTGMVLSKCYAGGKLSCLNCHSMHASPPNQQLTGGSESDESCFQCHPAHRGKVAEHTHHQPGTPGASCYNCHMPRTNYGLLKAIRSHMITIPSADATIETNRPNACNLCHLDKTLKWTADNLEAWYGIKTLRPMSDDLRNTAAGPYSVLKGDAALRALIGWHMGWKPALDACGDAWVPPYLIQMLDDPYTPLRYIAGRSLSHVPGFEEFVFDYVGPETKIRDEKLQMMDKWERVNAKMIPRSELFVGEGPRIQREPYEKLLAERDNTPILVEE